MHEASGESVAVQPATVERPPIRSIKRSALIGLAAIGGVLMLGRSALADCGDVCNSEFNFDCYGGGEFLGYEPCHGGYFSTIFSFDFTEVFTNYSGGGYAISSPCMGFQYSFCSIYMC